MRIQTPSFAHKYNTDGSIDSFCPNCFIKVSTSNSPPDIEAKELEHKCDPELLELEERYKRAESNVHSNAQFS